MAEYIEREAALRTAHIMRPEDKCLETELMKIPAADVAPVVHGRWVVRFDGPYQRRRCYCSHCGKHNGVGGIAQNQTKPYCPNCGARMDGESNGKAD